MRRLVVCSTCKFAADQKFAPDGRTGGQVLIDALQELLARRGRPDVRLDVQSCLWNCTRPCSVIIQDDQRYSYVTGGHAPRPEQAEAILAWFDQHGESETGEVPFRQWPDLMRGHFIARLPPARP